MSVINVNQVGCFLGMKAAMPVMRDSGGGSIVNISSIDGIGSKNGLISYTLDNGWGFTANTLITSPINNNVAATIVIPWQFEVDAGVTYKYSKQWDYRLSVGNVTNEKNWAPPNAVYGNGSILALAGTTFSFNAKYSF